MVFLCSSSNTCLWPILCLVKNVNAREPFVVGLFCGKQKPKNAVLAQFVADANNLMSHGLMVGEKNMCGINSFVCLRCPCIRKRHQMLLGILLM